MTARWIGSFLAGCVVATAQADPATCDAASHFTVLSPDTRPVAEAHAVWLDRQRLRWPSAPEGTMVLDADGEPIALQREGDTWQLPAGEVDPQRLRAWHRGPLRVVARDAQGRDVGRTRTQAARALDDLYAAAAIDPEPLGATPEARGTAFRLWAPTARAVALCLHEDDRAPARSVHALQRDEATGAWTLAHPADLSGRYYTYLVDVWVDGLGLVRQRVTDPYSFSLGADSKRSWIGRLDDRALSPPGWERAPRGRALVPMTDLVIYELHLRDFSLHDPGVPAAHRGRYTAFEFSRSAGMRHLRALARAGLTDVHLLPVFDFATVPEQGCTRPRIPRAAPDALDQQAAVKASAARDCFNWGYDPLHFNAPEGSYASRADDGAVRIREFRRMVMALHRAGLRVGLDVVYNHMSASGQHHHSVLDRIVPGYYHRLDAAGRVATSTCCANTATEHAMMARLMTDSVRLWARHYRIDSFRFDLMGHQPREVMERLRALLRQDQGREIQLLGEGWNFGEVADGARFVQASQLSLAGSGIASFSDRGRDALRGGGHGDAPDAVLSRKGWLNGADDPALADRVRLALAGTLRSYRFTQSDGSLRRGDELRYGGQIAGYAAQPGEAVNYVENHDNQTLWDLHALKLPLATSSRERARAQVLGLAATALSQGVAYFHAGVDLLRSKSMDVNSFDSGDWFNRVDWSGRSSAFGSGLPPLPDNASLHPLMAPRLADPRLRPTPADIDFTRHAMREWLAVRASTRLLRLDSADAVQRRLRFHGQEARLIVAEVDGEGLPDAGFPSLLYALNADTVERHIEIPALAGRAWRLHPALRSAAKGARVDGATGWFRLPPLSAAVWVVPPRRAGPGDVEASGPVAGPPARALAAVQR